jgi:predicted RNA polymerase sigma factor
VAAELELEESLAATFEDEAPAGDDTLLLLFMCCHLALTPTSAIALTLRAVGGLTTAEIARAFLVSEATMAQRISRAKQSVKGSGVPFARPSAEIWPERLKTVLHVLYLMFNEGYAASDGPELLRVDLAEEAIRLVRSLARVLSDDGEVTGLLALMLLTHARRAARTAANGDLVPLDEQERSLWDGAAIAEGLSLVAAALGRGGVGPYRLQAAIAAIHDEAKLSTDTDWRQILALYDVLAGLADNPMVLLNRAVALAMVEGPQAGLAALALLDADARLAGHHRLAAVRAHLLERAGEREEAPRCYRAAAARTTSLPEQRYLAERARRLEQAPGGAELTRS